jgi:hemopexin
MLAPPRRGRHRLSSTRLTKLRHFHTGIADRPAEWEMSVTAKTVYFFKSESYVGYDARRDVLVPNFSRRITEAWNNWPSSFASGVDAAVNWGDGRIFFFKGPKYLMYDVLANRVPHGYPVDIVGAWPHWPSSFASGVDAAINWGDGNVYFFKGPDYLRYNIGRDRVDEDYPMKINVGTWKKWPTRFNSHIDAAVNWADGRAFFFKGSEYLAYDMVHDGVMDNYPRPIAPDQWPALAGVGFTSGIGAALEWPHAEVKTFDAPVDRGGCVGTVSGSLRETFDMRVEFASTPYPAACFCGEYRQFARGDVKINGGRIKYQLADPAGGTQELLPRPAPGQADDNFREDGRPAERSPFGARTFYGHRQAAYGNDNLFDQYLPDRAAGCSYRGHDNPGSDLFRPGMAAELDIDFRGQVIDVVNGGEVLDTRHWTVQCRKDF